MKRPSRRRRLRKKRRRGGLFKRLFRKIFRALKKLVANVMKAIVRTIGRALRLPKAILDKVVGALDQALDAVFGMAQRLRRVDGVALREEARAARDGDQALASAVKRRIATNMQRLAADAVLEKPFNRQALASCIRHQLDAAPRRATGASAAAPSRIAG